MIVPRICIITALLFTVIPSAIGELKLLSGPLEATSTSVRYVTSYLVDPGSIDLSHVSFVTSSENSALFSNNDDRYDNVQDDITMLDDDDDDDDGNDDQSITDDLTDVEDHEQSMNETSNNSTSKNDQSVVETDDDNDDDNDDLTRYLAFKEFTLDILFFLEPSNCAKTKQGCDWTELGIGSSDTNGNLRWCCSEDAVSLGLCSTSQVGRMIVNADKYKGEHRFVNVPEKGEFSGSVSNPVMSTHSGSGQYTLLLANCNDYGRDVEISGISVWKSKDGYLPGDLFDEWHFEIFLFICYIILLVWYSYSMKINKESIIGIQKWILGTIILGFIQVLFRTVDYSQWNAHGKRSDIVMYTWIIVGVLKDSISRCLLIMVCLGWGVIRDTLGDQMKKIVALGVLYLSMAFLRDISGIVFVEEMHVLSESKEEAIYDLFTFFTLVTAFIDVVCYMWILDALNGTMQYLENMNQAMKLKRYLRLRLILLLSILFALFWTVMGVVDDLMETAVLAENQNWIIPGAWSMNYLFILASISLLWRPDPRAKEMAYVMELPSIGNDLNFDTNIGTIDDDDFEDNDNEMNINNAVAT